MLTKAYQRHIDEYISTVDSKLIRTEYTDFASETVKYLHWDMQTLCGPQSYRNVADILPLLADGLLEYGFFMISREYSPTNISTNSAYDAKSTLSGGCKRMRAQSIPEKPDQTPTFQMRSSESEFDEVYNLLEATVLRNQTGVFRVNCLDCLDR